MGKSLMCFLTGAMVGTVATLFLAPDSGANTRAKLADAANDLKKKAKARITEDLEDIESVLE